MPQASLCGGAGGNCVLAVLADAHLILACLCCHAAK